MSRNYDNWERLVSAVIKKEQLWQLFHAHSRSPSISSSGSSGLSFSFYLASSLEDAPFSSPEWSAFGHKARDDDDESILVKDEDQFQFPVESRLSNKDVTFKPSRKRDLKIQVPNPRLQHYGAYSPTKDSLEYYSKTSPTPKVSPTSSSRVLGAAVAPVHPRAGKGHSESQANWPDDAKQQSHPLPLPPAATSNSSPSSRPNPAAASPSVPSHSPERAGNAKSPGTSWKKGKLIGRGPLGDVYLGFNSEKGEMCAMKEITLSFTKSKQSARALGKEIALLSRLRHPNIVQYYGSEMVGDNFYIYFEYVSGGSIFRLLQQYGKLGEPLIRSYTHQILSGLAYLHSKSIAHRDIKGDNILVDPDGRVKLINLGIEKNSKGQSHPSLVTDSPYWMAPEFIRNPTVRNLAMDIWSLGCSIVEMATSKPPIRQYNEVRGSDSKSVALFKVANNRDFPTIPDHLSRECKDFLRHCLQWNPLHRATASQLLKHPFVKSSPHLEKQLLVSTSADHHAVTDDVKSEGIAHARSLHQLDSGRSAIHPKEVYSLETNLVDIYTPRNISTPLSPIGSPLPHPRSPQRVTFRMAPSTMPIPVSPSSRPRTGGIGSAIPYPHVNQLMVPQEISDKFPKHSPSINSPSYWDPNILRGLHSGTHAFQETVEDALGKQFRMAADGRLYGQPVLADHAYQPLFRAPVKLKTSVI